MARGWRDGASLPTNTNEEVTNGEVPPSTRAAQLAEYLVDGKGGSKSQDEESYLQLLREVLGTGPDQSANEETLETDVDVNRRLIFVIVKAGIEMPAEPNPFLNKNASNSQIIESLKAVNVTIRRTPAVLFSAPFYENTGSNHHGLVYQWLFPKILGLSATSQEPDVHYQVVTILSSCILAEKKLQRPTSPSQAIWTYVKGFTRDLIHYMEGEPSTGDVVQEFPGLETFAEVEASSGSENASELFPQLSIGSVTQASSVAVTLLRSVIQFGFDQSSRMQVRKGKTPLATAWAVGTILQLWTILGSRIKDLNMGRRLLSPLTILMDAARVVTISIIKKRADTAAVLRLIHCLSEMVVSALEILNPGDASLLEEAVCACLLDLITATWSSDPLYHAVGEVLATPLKQMSDDRTRFHMLAQDTQNSLGFARHLIGLRGKSSDVASSLRIPSFQDQHLTTICATILSQIEVSHRLDDLVRPLKRIRLSNTVGTSRGNGNSVSTLVTDIYRTLDVEAQGIEVLAETSINRYNSMSDILQSQFFRQLGLLACASARKTVGDAGKQTSEARSLQCDGCDAESGQLLGESDANVIFPRTVLNIISAVIDQPRHQKSRQSRVAAMMAFRRALSHVHDESFWDLASVKLGQWCLQALQSSIRELRIAAGRTLPIFLTDPVPDTLVAKNRRVALDFLRGLSDRRDIALQETCILTWGQIVRKLNEGDEMNLVLLKLVEYLGHPNSLLNGLAFDELQRICNHSQYTAMKLFAPYWRSIAVTIVQDLHRRPQIAQHVSELLGMTVSDFLVLTQVHTIPFLVLTKRHDVLQRIAEACGQSIMGLCREHNNLAAILSTILLRNSSEADSLVMALLNAVSPEFQNLDCAELLKSEPQATAAELLKFAGEEDQERESKAHQALHFLANITHSRTGSSRSSRRTDTIGPFFENHVLGIMALLADTINDGKGPQPVIEKIRCLGAVREMMKLAKGHVCNGLPQICACLRSAISNPDLSNSGLEAWTVMIDVLADDDIAGLIDPTFALIVQHWDLFSTHAQGQAYDMISRVLKSRTSLIREIVHTLPSLGQIPLMAKFEEELGKLKSQMDVRHRLQAFGQRCQNENATVVTRALIELVQYLQEHKDWIYDTAGSEQPDSIVSQLTRSILDTSILFSDSSSDIAILCAQSLGLIGCLDYTKIEALREKKDILVLSNFTHEDEAQEFVIFFLREVLVKAFLCAMNSRSQGFLAYAMQELLAIGGFRGSVGARPRDTPQDENHQRWASLPESMRALLTPFLDSKYFVTAGVPQPPCIYPIFAPHISHRQWIRTLAFDLLRKNLGNEDVKSLFAVLSRIIRSQDTAISEFLLPYAVLNVVINGTDQDKSSIAQEMLAVLDFPLPDQSAIRDSLILCSQTIFRILDYLSRWMQEKKKEVTSLQGGRSRTTRVAVETEVEMQAMQISSVEALLNLVPADVISRRAVDCKSFSRALFHWEQYIRQEKQKHLEIDRQLNAEPLYQRLQDIYTQINEPDGIEGISAHLHILNIDQQILEHRKAGRWTAAQSWYQMSLGERPNDADLQFNLLTSLKESGQYDAILKQINSFESLDMNKNVWLPFAAEAAWNTHNWDKLKKFVSHQNENDGKHFNVEVGRLLLALYQGDSQSSDTIFDKLRNMTARSLSHTSASSMQMCHEAMLEFHVLADIEIIQRTAQSEDLDKAAMLTSLDRRLNMLGPFLSDKQYLLGIRRAAMQCFRDLYSNNDIASAWLASARLARKGNFSHQAFDAVLHASQLGHDSAMIEHSRLLWRESNHRKAIKSLESAIVANAFRSHDYTETDESTTVNVPHSTSSRNILKAKAHLLLAKWVDRAGQTQSDAIKHEYKKAIECYNRWEKGHYYLGKHYNKLLESEKAKPPSKQAQTFINGETAKLVVENYLRALAFGAKYIYQTLPRILTLWLELGSDAEQPLDPKYGNDESFRNHIMSQRRKLLAACNSQVKKYTDRLPAFVFYTAFSQIVARICHPHQAVYNLLVEIIAKVVCSHPPQALWALLAVVKSSSRDRAQRGAACLTRVLETSKKARSDTLGSELKAFVLQSQRLSDQLLHVCEGEIHGKATNVSLSKNLGFNHKTAVCKLAVPLEWSLTASLPAPAENFNMRQHKAFNTHDYVSISSFLDDVLVLNSLQRPRRISMRGSDGRVYALLCKPKDDLRKDQRLMEFNNTINRALKKDAESSKRRLYIKTYAVTPLNEECGLIEWVDNLKTLRDILMHNYRQKNIPINYSEIKMMLNESISTPKKLPIFTDKVVPYFPPVFHEWFVEKFPEPGAWYTARLRYTRSCAVMSMVGHVLGLGDRHGENILFEEGNGGTLHVDFNCLFDKGLTFEKPELVPFRLTHNMVDAFGAQGCEGPFRKSCELSLGILRGYEDTLMTILETFLYDPTTDFIGKKKKTNPIVPDTPEGVLENVRSKVRGLLPGESVPLSVEGHVEELIRQARDPWNLANMYIGWCAFF